MNLSTDFIFTFDCNLNNDKSTYEQIASLYNELLNHKEREITVDFKHVQFISANLFAVLGACFDKSIVKNNNLIKFTNVNPSIQKLMTRNKFAKYLNIKSQEDKYNTCIKYNIFSAQTEQLEEFEKYLIFYIFEHKEIPIMSSEYKNLVMDNFLEIFNNVIDHAEAKSVYVCGQYFRRKNKLEFSIVDIGKTFTQKINLYFSERGKSAPEKHIEWALGEGNSTKINEPGGLGLTTLLEFLQYNNGSFTIVSHDELYEYNSKGSRTIYLDNCFPGTIVTISVNLQDNNLYIYNKEKDETIIF